MLARISNRLLLVFLVAFLAAPTIAVVIVSFGNASVIQLPPKGFSLQWYGKVLTDPAWLAAIGRILMVSLLAVILAGTAGTMLAFAIARGGLSATTRKVFQVAAIFPLAIPPVVIALGGYTMWSRLGITNSIWSLVPLYAALGCPFVFLSALGVLEKVGTDLDQASASLGATRSYTLRRVTLPLILPAVLTGCGFALLTCMEEIVIALFLLGGHSETLPLKIYASLNFGVAPDIAAVTTLQIGLAVAVAIAGAVWSWLRQRRRQLVSHGEIDHDE